MLAELEEKESKATLDINNGDTGLLVKRDALQGKEGDSCKLVLQEKERELSAMFLVHRLKLGKTVPTCATYKSQGSEYKHALFVPARKLTSL